MPRAKRTVKVPVCIYEKEIVIKLTGGDKDQLTKVAHEIHKTSNIKEIVGGLKRSVTMTHESSDPKVIFRGVTSKL